MATSTLGVIELERLGATPAVASAIVRLRDELTRTATTNLAGLVLYGGLARGRFRPGRSDVNLAVILRDAGREELEKIAPTLRKAYRAARVEPFILTPDEVRETADVFATKLLDIRDHHLVLHGEDPFARLEVEPEHIRLRVEQELRNLCLRLRRRYVAISGDAGELERVLVETVAPLAVELGALLRLAGKPAAGDDAPVVFAAAAAALDLDAPALAGIVRLRDEPNAPREDLQGLYGRVLASVVRAATVADRLEVGR